MRKPPLPVAIALSVVALVAAGAYAIAHRPFPPDTTPEGAYARIALAVANAHPRDAFAYLETEAQWASYSIRDARKKARDRVEASYPVADRASTTAPWAAEAEAPDGADVFALFAVRRGWLTRLERDLSGAAHVAVQGGPPTAVTAPGARVEQVGDPRRGERLRRAQRTAPCLAPADDLRVLRVRGRHRAQEVGVRRHRARSAERERDVHGARRVARLELLDGPHVDVGLPLAPLLPRPERATAPNSRPP